MDAATGTHLLSSKSESVAGADFLSPAILGWYTEFECLE